jgi:hypothetical protein
MTYIKNEMNIENLEYHTFDIENYTNNTLLFSYLYITNEAFRKSSAPKQIVFLKKYRIVLGKQIKTLFDKGGVSSRFLKTISETFNDDILDNDMNIDTGLLYIFENVLKTKYIPIIFESDMFVAPLLTEKNNFSYIMIYKSVDTYYPMSVDGKYSFGAEDDIIGLINLYNVPELDNVDNVDSIINDIYDDNYDEVVSYVEEQIDVLIVEEDDVFIYDLDDDISLIMEGYKADIPIEDYEMYIHSLFEKTDYAIPKFANLLTDIAPNKHLVLHMKETKRANLMWQNSSITTNNFPEGSKLGEEKTSDSEFNSFLKNMSIFKCKFSWKPFISSPYETNEPTRSKVLKDEEIIIIDQNTTAENPVIDEDTCVSNFKIGTLFEIAKKHNLQTTTNKSKLCHSLVSHNFILDHMISKYNNMYSREELEDIAESNNIQTNVKGTKQLISVLINNNVLPAFCENNTLTMNDYEEIAEKHNLPINENLYQACRQYSNFNLLVEPMPNSDENLVVCREDIELLTTEVDEIQIPHQFDYTKVLKEDGLYTSGFFVRNDVFSQEVHTFDIDDYIKILNDIHQFLPIKCVIKYYRKISPTNKNTGGIILEINGGILKIRTNDKKILYYNLVNISNNNCFIYTNLHTYHFNKSDLLTTNIDFVSNKLSFEEQVDIVRIRFDEYVHMLNPKLENNITVINRFLKQFKVDYLSIDRSTFNLINNQTDPIVLFEDLPSRYLQVEPPTLFSFYNDVGEKRREYQQKFDIKFINDMDRHVFFSTKHTVNGNELEKLQSFVENNFKERIDYINGLFNSDIEKAVSPFSENTIPRHTPHDIKTFDELVKFKEDVRTEMDDYNIKELKNRYYILNDNRINIKTILETHWDRFISACVFSGGVHDKQLYLQGMKYISYETSDKVDGDIFGEDTFLRTDGSASFTFPFLPAQDEKADKTLLDVVWKIFGLGLNIKAHRFINTKLPTYVGFLSKLLLRSHMVKFPTQNTLRHVFGNDQIKEALWLNYTKITIYCAFITILVQTKNITVKEKNSYYSQPFTTDGFPISNNTSNYSFSNYLAAVAISYFGKTNKYFENMETYQKKINTVIKLVLSYEPEIIVKLNDIKKKPSKLITTNLHLIDFKPTKQSAIRTFVSENISNIDFARDMRLTRYNLDNQHKLMDTVEMKIIHKPYIKLEQISFVTISNNVIFIEPVKAQPIVENVNMIDLDEGIFEFTNNFSTYYKIDLQEFIQLFVIKSDTNINPSNYTRCISSNPILVKIRKYLTEQTRYDDICLLDTVMIDTPNPLLNVYNMFMSLKKTMELIFKTDEPFTFLDYKLNTDDDKTFAYCLKTIQEHIYKMLKFVKNQNITFDSLTLKKHEYRSDEKNHEYSKYDAMDHGDVSIIKSLLKLGLTVDIVATEKDGEGNTEPMPYVAFDENDDEENW